MVVEAVPKSYGTDDVWNSTINFVMRVKWLSWWKDNERQVYFFSFVKSYSKLHSVPDQQFWSWGETSSPFHSGWCFTPWFWSPHHPHHLRHPAGGWTLCDTMSFLRGHPLPSPCKATGRHWHWHRAAKAGFELFSRENNLQAVMLWLSVINAPTWFWCKFQTPGEGPSKLGLGQGAQD